MARPNFFHTTTIAALLSWSVAPLAHAADVDADAAYVVSLGGINVANVHVKLTDSDRHYAIALDAKVSGLGSLVASGTASADSTGISSSNGLASEKFDLSTKAHDEEFSIGIQYARGDVTAFIVNPPLTNDINRIPIERSQLTGVEDMLAAFILKGGSLDKSLCERRMRIFTGVERFDIAMNYLADDKATSLRTGYQGPVVQCKIKYTPISGHFTTSEMTNYLAASDHILIWYAPMAATSYFIPYRVLIATSVGDLSMVLTTLKD